MRSAPKVRPLPAFAILALALGGSLEAQRVPLPKAAPIQTKTLAPMPPAGPAPQHIATQSATPLHHAFSWDKLSGLDGYRIFKTVNGVWSLLTPKLYQPIQGPTWVNSDFWADTAQVPPGTAYRFVAVYSDGREGFTDFVFANPPQPQAPTGLQVKQTGPGTVKLSWQGVPNAWYRVTGTGRPQEGTAVDGGATETTFTGLADGTYSYQVSSIYQGLWGPGSPPVGVAVTSTGRYRVVANGFKVLGHTGEDDRNGDGWRDEVYGGFAMFHVSRPSGLVLDKDLRRTQIHGDLNVGFGGVLNNGAIKQSAEPRIQAGSASGTGGLHNGDKFPPVLDPSQRYGQPISDVTFPYLIWDGFLTDAKDAVIIMPSLWESDGRDEDFTGWFLKEQTTLPNVWSDPMVQVAVNGKVIQLTMPAGWTYFPPSVNALTGFRRPDHPIGSLFDDAFRNILPGGATGHKLPRRAIVLTREILEAALTTGTGIVAIPLDDIGSDGMVGNGHYILYVQVERVP